MLSNGTKNSNFINLKLVSEPGETTVEPKFSILGNDYKETGETYSTLKGKLSKIRGTYTPAKGKMGDIYGFKAFFESDDGNDVYVLESTITNASKDLLNALIVNIGKVLTIQLYLNKKGYPSSSVKDENGNWAQTSMEYNKIDTLELYNKIKEEPSEDDGGPDNPF